MHLDAERMERLLDGELQAEVLFSTQEHLANCADCQALVQRARESVRSIHALLGSLDHPASPADLSAVVGRTGAPARRWLRWAAAIAFAMTLGGVAYAAQITGVRAFLLSLWHRTAVEAPAVPESGVAPAVPVAPATAGIAVRPGRELTIEFRPAAGGVSARVVLGDGDEVTVRAPVGAAAFSSQARRLVVDVREAATLDIEIPRAAPHVEVRVGTRRLFLTESSRVTSASDSAGTGAWTLSLDQGP